jgi:hypothetical protein
MTLIYLKHIPTNSSNINLPVNLNKCLINLLNFSLQQNNPFQNMAKMCSEINKLLFLQITLLKFIDNVTIIQKSVTQNYSINMLFITEITKAISEYKLHLLSLSLENFNQYSMHCNRVLLCTPTTSIDDRTYSGAFTITNTAIDSALMPIIINVATSIIPSHVIQPVVILPSAVIPPVIIPSVASAPSVIYQLPKRSKTCYDIDIQTPTSTPISISSPIIITPQQQDVIMLV